jgi:hypothetical protein
MDKLKLLFLQISDSPEYLPNVIIFLGNFTSREFGQTFGDTDGARAIYKNFAEVLAGYPEISQKTLFIFVPGMGEGREGEGRRKEKEGRGRRKEREWAAAKKGRKEGD